MANDEDTTYHTQTDDEGLDPGVHARVRRLAWLMDDSIPLPGGYRIGVDGFIGLIPGIGDGIGAVVSGYIIAAAAKAGAPASLLTRMALNVLVETVVGLVPFLGDLFDFAFKSNVRNVALIERHLHEPRRARRADRLVVFGLLLAVALTALGAALLTVKLLAWVWTVLSGPAVF
jgi:hypothetical protein